MEEPHEILRRCPFCGAEASAGKNSAADTYYYVWCSNQSCAVRPESGAYSREEAVAAWNLRPVEQELRKLLFPVESFIRMLVDMAIESPMALRDYYSRRDIRFSSAHDIERAREWIARTGDINKK